MAPVRAMTPPVRCSPRHEPQTTMEARLERLVARVTTLAFRTSAALPRLFLKGRHTWDRGVFAPSHLSVEEMVLSDHHDAQTALIHANEVTLLTAWRFARHVARIDEGVLETLRQAGPPPAPAGGLAGPRPRTRCTFPLQVASAFRRRRACSWVWTRSPGSVDWSC